jgi:hypothetical protein
MHGKAAGGEQNLDLVNSPNYISRRGPLEFQNFPYQTDKSDAMSMTKSGRPLGDGWLGGG